MNILRIDASGRRTGSKTRQATERIAGALGGTVTHRDLLAAPPVLVTEQIIGAYFTAPQERGDAQKAAIAPSDAVVAELKAADVVVIGMPIYNFGVPAALKGWADMAARAGETFRYTEYGPEGLLDGKRAIIAVASGGTAPGSEIDWATPWMRFFLGFMGIDDVTVISADASDAEITAAIRGEAPALAA